MSYSERSIVTKLLYNVIAMSIYTRKLWEVNYFNKTRKSVKSRETQVISISFFSRGSYEETYCSDCTLFSPVKRVRVLHITGTGVSDCGRPDSVQIIHWG